MFVFPDLNLKLDSMTHDIKKESNHLRGSYLDFTMSNLLLRPIEENHVINKWENQLSKSPRIATIELASRLENLKYTANVLSAESTEECLRTKSKDN